MTTQPLCASCKHRGTTLANHWCKALCRSIWADSVKTCYLFTEKEHMANQPLDFSDDTKLQTRRGNPVRIYATDAGGDYPVHGAEFVDDVWVQQCWLPNGSYSMNTTTDSCDLIPKPHAG